MKQQISFITAVYLLFRETFDNLPYSRLIPEYFIRFSGENTVTTNETISAGIKN